MNYNGWYIIKPNETKSYYLIYMYKKDKALNGLQSYLPTSPQDMTQGQFLSGV